MEIKSADETSLGDLLHSFREAGRMDSQGIFTMSGRKAAGKLAKSLLPGPADWILKVVQGACLAGAENLRISQTGKATHIEFLLPYRVDNRALERSLVQGVVASQPGIEAISTALRVVGLGQDRAWVARLRMDAVTHWVVVQAGEVSLETVSEGEGEPGGTEVLLGIAFPPGQPGKVGGLVRFGAAVQNEHEALLQRARACPISLTLDGTRIDNLQRYDSLGGLEYETFLGVAHGASTDLSPIVAPSGLYRADSHGGDRFRDAWPFYQSPSQSSASGSSFMRVAFRYLKERHTREGASHAFRPLPSPSRVVLVRHGVVVGKRNLGLTEPVAVDVYLNADDARADLSGLEVEVLTEHVDAAKRELQGLGPFLERLEMALATYVTGPGPREMALYGGVGGLALLFAPWPIKLAALGLSAVQLRTSALAHRRMVRDCQQEVANFQQRHCRADHWAKALAETAAGEETLSDADLAT